ncbi:MAG: hypothetical protein ACE366_22720 [Bradymonadia bacterium]
MKPWPALIVTCALCACTDDPVGDARPDDAQVGMPDIGMAPDPDAVALPSPDAQLIDAFVPDSTPLSDADVMDASLFDAGMEDRPDAAPDAQVDALTLTVPDDVTLDEGEPFVGAIDARAPGTLEVFVFDLPPGAHWHPGRREITFTPDFIQGPDAWTIRVLARSEGETLESTFTVNVRDNIRPPAPEIIREQEGDGFTRLQLRQRTDGFLDHPDEAGRTFDGYVMAPDERSPAGLKPVRILLHGFASQPPTEGWRGEYRIAPHDPFNTYWWGYQGSGDAGPQPYTVRRVLHLLHWVLERYPDADVNNVYIEGASMGGAGAATMGLLWGRHFNMVHSTIAQWVPRNHRPSRLAQLGGHWGAPGPSWDVMDLTDAMASRAEAQNQYVFLKHGKDDGIIHFGAVIFPSPLTGLSAYQALQAHHVGHMAVWDEGGHGIPDPILGDQWWTQGWNPVFDDTAWLRRGVAFPVFSNSSGDDDPGDGSGNGRRPFDEDTGYAGGVFAADDTGWSGDVAGALNRALRWDSNGLVDEMERFEIPLRVLDVPNGDAPRAGWPTPGDVQSGPIPVRVDVTLRRVQRFQVMPGASVRWRFGALEGVTHADESGVITVPEVPVSSDWQTLMLQREE